jgi:hypothetical protein
MTSQEMKKTLWEAADKLRAWMDAVLLHRASAILQIVHCPLSRVAEVLTRPRAALFRNAFRPLGLKPSRQ